MDNSGIKQVLQNFFANDNAVRKEAEAQLENASRTSPNEAFQALSNALQLEEFQVPHFDNWSIWVLIDPFCLF